MSKRTSGEPARMSPAEWEAWWGKAPDATPSPATALRVDDDDWPDELVVEPGAVILPIPCVSNTMRRGQ